MRLAWLIALALSACIESSLVPCGDELCPIGDVCTPGGCATPEAANVCIGHADGDGCDVPAIPFGVCRGGACYPVECGDGMKERSEVCDDGNLVDGDGCSSTCAS